MKFLAVAALITAVVAAAPHPIHEHPIHERADTPCGPSTAAETFDPNGKEYKPIYRCTHGTKQWFTLDGSATEHPVGSQDGTPWIGYLAALNEACIGYRGEAYGRCYDKYSSVYEAQHMHEVPGQAFLAGGH